MAKASSSVRIVLVHPRNPLNLLAAARAAMNFGFTEFTVVSPHLPIWEEAQQARGAQKWLRRAVMVGRLQEAIADCSCVLGASSLTGRRPDPQRVIALQDLRRFFARQRNGGRAALLFGSEKRGLSNQDLDYCHAIVRIPTVTGSASMNLGQAVAVCCYELSRPGGSPRIAGGTGSAAPVGQIVRLLDGIETLLPADRARASQRRARLLRMFLRWGLSPEELDILLGVLRDIGWGMQTAVRGE